MLIFLHNMRESRVSPDKIQMRCVAPLFRCPYIVAHWLTWSESGNPSGDSVHLSTDINLQFVRNTYMTISINARCMPRGVGSVIAQVCGYGTESYHADVEGYTLVPLRGKNTFVKTTRSYLLPGKNIRARTNCLIQTVGRRCVHILKITQCHFN